MVDNSMLQGSLFCFVMFQSVYIIIYCFKFFDKYEEVQELQLTVGMVEEACR